MELTKLISKLKFEHSEIKDKDFNKGGIYIIKSKCSEYVYIGKTYKSFIGRILGHQHSILKGKYHNVHLMRSIHKYGIENFSVSVIEFLPDFLQKIAWQVKSHKQYALEHPNEYKNLSKWLDKHERYWIAHFRKVGKVFNQNDGGNGGLNPSKDVRNRMSQNISASMKRYYSEHPEASLRLSKQTKTYFSNPEIREIYSLKAKKRFEKKEEHEKMSIAMKKRFEKKEEHEKISKSLKRRYKEIPEYLEKNRQTSIEMWKDDTIREHIITGMKRRFKKEGELEKHGNRSREYWKNPEYRNKVITSINKPEVKLRKGKHVSQTKRKQGKEKRLILKSLLYMLYMIIPYTEHMTIKKKQDAFYHLVNIISSKHEIDIDVYKLIDILYEYNPRCLLYRYWNMREYLK